MNEVLLGIDFGTTNTVITYFNNNKSETLLDGAFKTIPSKIGFMDDKVYFGNYIPLNCTKVIHSFKMFVGDVIPDTNYSDYSVDSLLILFFRHLQELVIKKLKLQQPILRAVITVPSNFNDKQREIIRYCFETVGFTVIRIINEPSAAALAYGLNHSSRAEEKILVIDTGGGTMDFTVLEKNELFFEVVHSEGLNDLGGNNFTEIIKQDIVKTNIQQSINYNILWNQSQRIKEKLTYLDVYETKINTLNESINYILTRSRFENLCNGLLSKVEYTLQNIVSKYSDINYVILVGGTSRIPMLQDIIKKVTNKTPWIHPNLESVVAEGAGLYAGIIDKKFTMNNDVILMDVLPLSLGVELVDGTYSVIIPKNTPLPVKRSQKYTTDSPGETVIKVKVYQGERKIANKNFLIGEIVFDKVSLGSVPTIEVAFKVDLNSIITVTIIDKKSGVEKNVVIKDVNKIDSAHIEELIDIANRSRNEDESELMRYQNIYLIRTHIENSLQNLQINDLINADDKKIILDKFNQIENDIDNMNELQLVETLKHLQDNYSILGTVSNTATNDDNSMSSDLEKLFFDERKNELKNKISVLLGKNPEWREYLEPVLEELSYNSCSIDYINDKLNTLQELEDTEERDYKQELNNLCLYLKSELEVGSINMGSDKNHMLVELINKNLELIVNKDMSNNINWEEQLNILNKDCEKIYNT